MSKMNDLAVDAKNEPTATPTPWRWAVREHDGIVSILSNDTDMLSVASMNDYDHMPAEANAEFIVRAVNSHADMLAALEYIVAWNPKTWSAEKARDMAKAAIAKARGQS